MLYAAFVESLARGQDPATGGAAQLVGLYRIGAGRSFGVVDADGKRHLAGAPVFNVPPSSEMRWHNDRFERTSGLTRRRLASATRHRLRPQPERRRQGAPPADSYGARIYPPGVAGGARPTAALLLGAGWSAAAGFPLAKDLVRGPIHVADRRSQTRVRAVLDAYADWCQRHPAGGAELFLAAVKQGAVMMRPRADEPSLFDAAGGAPLPWHWAVETVVLRLAWPDIGDPWQHNDVRVMPDRRQPKLRWGGKLHRPFRSPEHLAFVQALLRRFDLTGVVTANYDTLTERTLRPTPVRRDGTPGFHYGGLPRPQWALGSDSWDQYNSADPSRNAIELTGDVPLCKLHGSTSWEVEAGHVTISRDMRLVYRDGGSAAIVAPVPEKHPPTWLEPVWSAAADILSAAQRWVVVGYSLPPYDHAIRAMLAQAAAGDLQAVDLHDPYGEAIVDRWHDVTNVPVTVHPGLPFG